MAKRPVTLRDVVAGRLSLEIEGFDRIYLNGWVPALHTSGQVAGGLSLLSWRRRLEGRTSATRPGKGRWRAPDLVGRSFAAAAVNVRWYGDGTEIVTAEGKLYLALVLDMGSRRILGFALGEHHDAELAYGALVMAVTVRGGQVPGVVMHTDEGSEYTARRFRQACTRLGVRQ